MLGSKQRIAIRNLRWVYGAVFALTALYVIYPVFAQHKGSGPTRTLVELKDIGTALNIYLVDADDRFPPDTSCGRGIYRYIGDGIRDKSVLDTMNGDSHEWLGNGSLAFQIAGRIESPSKTLVIFDSAPRSTTKDSPGARKTMVADTSARTISEPEFQAIVVNRWNPPEAEEKP